MAVNGIGGVRRSLLRRLQLRQLLRRLLRRRDWRDDRRQHGGPAEVADDGEDGLVHDESMGMEAQQDAQKISSRRTSSAPRRCWPRPSRKTRRASVVGRLTPGISASAAMRLGNQRAWVALCLLGPRLARAYTRAGMPDEPEDGHRPQRVRWPGDGPRDARRPRIGRWEPRRGLSDQTAIIKLVR